MPTGGRCHWWAGLGVLLGLLAGCSTCRTRIDKALRQPTDSAPHAEQPSRYPVHCPDVLRLHVPGRPGWSGLFSVEVDGRIALGGKTRLGVDGRTPPEIAEAVARAAGLAPGAVNVAVAEFNSQQLFLFGEVSGVPRAVPYRGPERIVDLLRRAGGINPDASHHDIRIVRAHVAEGLPPEVFPVDLSAIFLENDPDTNLVVEPFDRIYIGQSKRSVVACCIPPWLRRLCQMAVNLVKGDKPAPLRGPERPGIRRGLRHLRLPPPPAEAW